MTKKTFAQTLRKNLTATELRLWYCLKLKQMGGYKFRRQHPIGQYVVDFVCLEKKLIIELDGGQHSERETYDTKRTKWLEGLGYKVLRFWDNKVFENPEGVKEAIWIALGETPHPASPSRGEEKEGFGCGEMRKTKP
ncbi:endonuclease domain-containing protein [Elusimicrobiota bacterium]